MTKKSRSVKQDKIIKFITENGRIKTSEANDLLKQHYYCNHEHYVAEILSRMVKDGTIQRKERGVYEFRNKPIEHNDKDQLNLF